ncbi:MAG: alpha/beta hydrolase [Adhaeribacter sp.]
MKKLLALIFLSSLIFTAACAGPGVPPQSQPESGKTGAKAKAAVQVLRNIRYGPKPAFFEADTSSDRLLDLYRPAGAGGPLPVILFIHGGGFSGGDKNATAAVCNSLSALGYAVLSINYRLELKRKKVSGASASANMAKGLPASGAFHPALQQAVSIASEDAQLALAWIREHAAEYGLNKSALAISGGSAGGMTALHTAYVSKQKALPITAVVNLWGGLENADLIKKGAPPVLTFHGDQDKLIHVDFAHAIKKRMEKIGNTQSELQVMEGLGHARYDVIAKEKADEIDAFLRKVFK